MVAQFLQAGLDVLADRNPQFGMQIAQILFRGLFLAGCGAFGLSSSVSPIDGLF